MEQLDFLHVCSDPEFEPLTAMSLPEIPSDVLAIFNDSASNMNTRTAPHQPDTSDTVSADDCGNMPFSDEILRNLLHGMPSHLLTDSTEVENPQHDCAQGRQLFPKGELPEHCLESQRKINEEYSDDKFPQCNGNNCFQSRLSKSQNPDPRLPTTILEGEIQTNSARQMSHSVSFAAEGHDSLHGGWLQADGSTCITSANESLRHPRVHSRTDANSTSTSGLVGLNGISTGCSLPNQNSLPFQVGKLPQQELHKRRLRNFDTAQNILEMTQSSQIQQSIREASQISLADSSPSSENFNEHPDRNPNRSTNDDMANIVFDMLISPLSAQAKYESQMQQPEEILNCSMDQLPADIETFQSLLTGCTDDNDVMKGREVNRKLTGQSPVTLQSSSSNSASKMLLTNRHMNSQETYITPQEPSATQLWDLGSFNFDMNDTSLHPTSSANVSSSSLKGRPFTNLGTSANANRSHGHTAEPVATEKHDWPSDAAKPSSEQIKLQRAIRNRESAKRSRLKNKMLHQKLNETYNFLRNENSALKRIVEHLVQNCKQLTPEIHTKLLAILHDRSLILE